MAYKRDVDITEVKKRQQEEEAARHSKLLWFHNTV